LLLLGISVSLGRQCFSCSDNLSGIQFCQSANINYTFCSDFGNNAKKLDYLSAMAYKAFLSQHRIWNPSFGCSNSVRNFSCYSMFTQCQDGNSYDFPCQFLCKSVEQDCQVSMNCNYYPTFNCTPYF